MFPGSFAGRCGHVTKLWPMGCQQKLQMPPLVSNLECACSGTVGPCGEGHHVSTFSWLDPPISPLDLLSLPPPSWGQTVCLPLTPALIKPDPGSLPQGRHPHPLTPPDNDISRLVIKATQSEAIPSRVPRHLPANFVFF